MSELHRPFEIAAIPDAGRAVDIAATPEECAAIAERLGLVALRDFRVKGRLGVRRRGRGASFEAHLTATVTQSCIVTLEPVEAAIDEEIAVRLLSEDEAQVQEELDIDAEEDDIEIVEGGVVDVGDLCVQYLALALDPYPRRPDAGT
jgi:uncharacterized metal-binding protein YceD (DUF177 family)